MSAVQPDHDQLRPEAPTTYYDGAVKIPGFGSPPDRCRAMKPVGFCENGHEILGRSSCQTKYCPDHWRDWAEDAVISMVARMAAYRYAMDGAEKRANHVVASPPQDQRYSIRELWETRSEAYEAFEAAGVRGGPVVTHPYRTNLLGDELYEAAQAQGEVDDGTGKWAYLRGLADDWEDLSRTIEAAPHYHNPVAPATDVDSEAAPEGWIIERIRSLAPFYLYEDEVPAFLLVDDNGRIERGRTEVVREGFEDMVASAYYVLTHSGEQQGRQGTTWFGDAHPASFDPEAELSDEAWGRIQKEAEKAVKEDPAADGEGGVSAGPDECPHDNCEAVVKDLIYLPEYLGDDEWVESIRSEADGRERIARLRGAYAWWDNRTDRPPPSVQSDEERMRNWLEMRGEKHMAPIVERQVTIQTAIMGQ